jgi:hypothetical protein
MSLKNDMKNEAIKAGSKVAAGLFSRWMDSIARRRPNGLVARFRRRFGRLTEEQVGETAEEYVKRAVEEANRRRGK